MYLPERPAFLNEYLESVLARIVEPKTGTLQVRNIFALNTEHPGWARTIGTARMETSGKVRLVAAGSAITELPKVSFNTTVTPRICYDLGLLMSLDRDMIRAFEAARLQNARLPDPMGTQVNLARRLFAEGEEQAAFGTQAITGIPGIADQADPDKVFDSTHDWTTATPDEIMEDWHELYLIFVDEGNFVPKVIILPRKYHTALLQPRTTGQEKTILRKIQEDYPDVQQIVPCNSLLQQNHGSAELGDYMVAVDNDPANVTFVEVQEITENAPIQDLAENITWRIYERIAGLDVTYPGAVAVMKKLKK